MPPEGILESFIPGIEGAAIRIQACPDLGARFVQMLLEIRPGGGMRTPRNDGTQSFFYVVSGRAELEFGGQVYRLQAGGVAYIPAGMPFRIYNTEAVGGGGACIEWIRKPYEKAAGIEPPPAFVSITEEIPKTPTNTKGHYWQPLIPNDDLRYDFVVNLLSFEPGTYFPVVETHVMEHGLYMLKGQGMYSAAGKWYECWEKDFIYLAPYCPQYFCPTGWSESSYLLYKNVNRDVSLLGSD